MKNPVFSNWPRTFPQTLIGIQQECGDNSLEEIKTQGRFFKCIPDQYSFPQ